jgi:hypothetical protein
MDAKDVSLEQRIAAHETSKHDRGQRIAPMPVEEPARSAEACRRVLSELLKVERYECRAISRRERAIREMLKAKTKSPTNQ